MIIEKTKALKLINQSHTFSKLGLKLIDDLIDRHTLVCFVQKGIIYDFDAYTRLFPDSFTEPFQINASRGISDFLILESLARLVLAERYVNSFWAAIAFADQEIISDDMRSLNSSLGFANDELIFTQKLGADFSLRNMASQIISQPFVSFGVSRQAISNSSSVQFACLNIQDGDSFLFIA